MAITTYATLEAAVSSWLDIDSSNISNQIADIVMLAEQRILREARTKDNEATLALTIGATGQAALPADYVALKFCYITTSPSYALERRSAEWIYSEYPARTSSGMPRFIAREGSNFIFGPYPDSGYSIAGVYYKSLGPLSSAVYDLFTNNPDLYLFGCLAEAELIIGRDPRVAIWESKYQRILSDVNGFSKAEDNSGSTLRMRLG